MIIEGIVTQHAEEAAFLWLQRDAAVCESHYDLKDLAELDQRVEAHVDGLRIAGDAGWEICRAQLGFEEPGEVFAAAILAFESKNEERVQAVFDIGTATMGLARALVSAFGWIPYAQVVVQTQRLLRAETATLRRVGIAGCAIHRQDPGAALEQALSDDDALLRARALKAVGELGRKDQMRTVRARLSDADEGCRFAAASTAVLLGEKSPIMDLHNFAGSPDWGEKALKLGMRASELREAHEWQRELVRAPKTLRLGIIGAGHIGDPILIPWLIEQMSVPDLARIAGEAFTFISGVDLSYENLDRKPPEGFESGPTEDPEDENVEMDPDEDLPWPDLEKIEGWWSRNRSSLQPGTRHLHGKPITPAWMLQVLKVGHQRQRAAAALELSLALPGRPLFEVRAPGFRQQQMLQAQKV